MAINGKKAFNKSCLIMIQSDKNLKHSKGIHLLLNTLSLTTGSAATPVVNQAPFQTPIFAFAGDRFTLERLHEAQNELTINSG